jgi:hypothetical protein
VGSRNKIGTGVQRKLRTTHGEIPCSGKSGLSLVEQFKAAGGVKKRKNPAQLAMSAHEIGFRLWFQQVSAENQQKSQHPLIHDEHCVVQTFGTLCKHNPSCAAAL